MIRLATLILLSSCLQAEEGPRGSAPNPDLALGEEEFVELVYDGAAGATRGVAVLQEMVAGWDDAERRDALGSVDALITTCPYNRLGAQVPLALSIAVSRWEPERVDIEIRAEWRRLQAGLKQHVALLEALGVGDLRAPKLHEHLFQFPGFNVTRADLQASPDPIALTRDHLEQLSSIVERLDSGTMRFLEELHIDLDRHTAPHISWPFPLLNNGWRVDLLSMEPHITDPDLAREVRSMIEMIEAFANDHC
jgi:hypothetical protein